MINSARMLNNLHQISRIGQDDSGGISRLAYSKAYFEALYKLKKLAEKKGFEIYQDKVGNLFITYNPFNHPTFIMLGSHLDTVKNGGLYDGALGVFAGLEVLESIQDSQYPLNHGLLLVAFNAEEGGPMGGTFGSRTISGAVDLEDPHLAEKLSHYLLTIDDVKESQWDFENVKAFIELHIEQGSYLEDHHYEIGVVEGIVAIYRYDIYFYGVSNHAGTTPMKGRQDPIPQMARFITYLYEAAQAYDHPFVMTVGDISVKPGMYNVIPNEAGLHLEIRDIDVSHLKAFIAQVEKHLADHFQDYRLIKNVEKPSSLMDPQVIKTIEAAAHDLNFKYVTMSSGAGHDTNPISEKVSAGMIFVPSVGGVSHSPLEFTHEDQIIQGTQTLLQTVLNLDQNYSNRKVR